MYTHNDSTTCTITNDPCDCGAHGYRHCGSCGNAITTIVPAHDVSLTSDSGTDAAWCAICGERLIVAAGKFSHEIVPLATLARELRELTGDMSEADSLEAVKLQVAIAGFPAAGAGMVSDHEWDENQFALLMVAYY